jgi:hypothetical protein
MGSGLIESLQNLEQVLLEEAVASPHKPVQGLLARKESALAQLQACMGQAESLTPDEVVEAAGRLRALMVANRFSLSWTAVLARWARIGQVKQPEKPTRPRLDLVH